MDRYLAAGNWTLMGESIIPCVKPAAYLLPEGSCVMYAMQDYIGEDNFNKAMSAFIKANQFQRAPYANSVDYLDTCRIIHPTR